MADTYNFDVFLSHNGKDKPAVEQIARLLRDEYNQKAWLDKWNLVPGEAWQEALEDALDESQTFAVFLGPSRIGPWENEEMRSAISDRVRDSSRRVIPVLLPGAPDNRDLELPRFLRRATWVDFRSGLDDKEALYRLYCGITGQPPGDRALSAPSKVFSRKDWCLKHPYSEIPDFTGRVKERQMLADWLKDNKHPLLVLKALGGFGKSALTWYWIKNDLDPSVWPKVVWWSFYDDREFSNFVRETLEYLTGKPGNPTGTRQDVEDLLNELENPGILLVLDGFERALRVFRSMDAAYQEDDKTKAGNERDTDCVSPLAEDFLKGVSTLPELQGKVLMTTRLRPRILTGHGGMLLTGCDEKELTALDKADAVDFFHHIGINGTRAEIQSACEPYGYHPLSLRLLSGLIVKDFEHPRDISVAQKFNIMGDLKQRQHHVLEQSYNSLTPERQRLFSRIACFRGSIDYKALKAIAEKEATFDDDIHDLVERGLLHHTELDNKFDLHPIVRRFAYDRLTAADRTGAHQRLVNYFEAVPKMEKVQTLEDLAPVIELYHHMVRAGKFDEAAQLYYQRIKNPLYYQFGAYQTAIELLAALFADGESKPPHLKDERWQAWALNELANAYSLSGRPRRAVPLFLAGNEPDEKSGNKKGVAIGLGNVATQQLFIGALRQAERNLRRSIDLCRENKDEFEEAIGHRELGRVLFYRSEWSASEQELDAATKLFEKENNVQSLGVTWSYRALRFLLMRRADPQSSTVNLKSAIESASRALELAEGGDPHIGGAVLPRDLVRSRWLLGAAYRANGELTKAEENLSKAISMCRQINLVEEEANILLDLARLRYDRKNHDEARSLAEEALTITGRCGYVLQGADVNLFLAPYALEQEKDKAKAKEYAGTALKLARCDGPPHHYKVAYEEAERLLEKLK